LNATESSLAKILQTTGAIEHYHVPKYQREYTWGITEWETLLNDIEENNAGYFMGSIICVSDNNEPGPGESTVYDVVDGQQRLTTLTLLLMAIYKKLLDIKVQVSADSQRKHTTLLSDITRQIIHRKDSVNPNERGYLKDKDASEPFYFLRVQPSTQNSNLEDYLHLLSELQLINSKHRVNYFPVRKIYKAYEYFYAQVPDEIIEIDALMQKLNSLKFVHISVSSSADAFVLFESLNNRGIPLSAMDIIKNKMLSHLEKHHNMEVDAAYEEWLQLLEYLTDHNDQQRFLRQYYNAFKVYPDKKVGNYIKATRSNLINIYETYIKNDAKATLKELLQKAEIYNKFIDPDSNMLPAERKKLLADLRRVGSAPSYTFLLYLWSLKPELIEDRENAIDEILRFFIKYYVRRNITDYPNTRDLDTINMEVIENCDKHINNGYKISAAYAIDKFMNAKDRPSKITTLKEKLANNLYYYNYGMARYVLAKLDEEFHTREYKPDLWLRSQKELYVWTVEHILPQGKALPPEWLDMIANGDQGKAKQIQNEIGHCLGNLTLSGYNSKLSNSSFEEKQSLHENHMSLEHKINIGYKNDLALNKFPFVLKGKTTNLAEVSEWTKDSIVARNEAMVDYLLKLFAFNQKELDEIDKQIPGSLSCRPAAL
jgi:uncharacterized protein with ParB-like and HNH nuclease domain